jgi:hypothetical protein
MNTIALVVMLAAPAQIDAEAQAQRVREAKAALALATATATRTTPSPKAPAQARPILRQPAPPPVRQQFASYPPGYHEHQCSRCGQRWGGAPGSHGHNCPNCGKYNNVHADGIRMPPPAPPVRMVPRVALPQSLSDCPT